MSPVFTQDPDAILDYTFDWSPWLHPGEAIAVSSITVSPGLTIGPAPAGPAIFNTATAATAWLSGGTLGRPYSVVNEITTDQGRTERSSLVVRIEET